MHIKIATAIVLSLAFAVQQRGWVSSVTASPESRVGTVQVTVTGRNPCGSVSLDFGDGTRPVTHAIAQLPATITHDYTRTGDFRVRARGMGNCDGDVFTEINVPRVGSIFDRGRSTNRFAEWDQNGDGVITRAEWRGTVQAFDDADWNNDGRLSGDEVRQGAQRPVEFTEAQFRRFDRNKDNYLSGTEWRYEPDDFVQVDTNRDDRVSLNEFLSGDVWIDTPGNRGRGRGRGLGRGNTQPFSIVVNNRQAWIDTGIDVRSGDQLTISATGTVRFSRRVSDSAGPNGSPGHRAPGKAPMPREEIGALVARVGNSVPFFVGSNRNGLRAPQTGRLYLGVNDDNLKDNSGEFRVSVLVNGRGR